MCYTSKEYLLLKFPIRVSLTYELLGWRHAERLEQYTLQSSYWRLAIERSDKP